MYQEMPFEQRKRERGDLETKAAEAEVDRD
jgi:hypothetical protein